MSISISLAALLERFFAQRLMQQRQASPHTISSYSEPSSVPEVYRAAIT